VTSNRECFVPFRAFDSGQGLSDLLEPSWIGCTTTAGLDRRPCSDSSLFQKQWMRVCFRRVEKLDVLPSAGWQKGLPEILSSDSPGPLGAQGSDESRLCRRGYPDAWIRLRVCGRVGDASPCFGSSGKIGNRVSRMCVILENCSRRTDTVCIFSFVDRT